MNAAGAARRPDVVERRLPPEPLSVGVARRLVRDLLLAGERSDLTDTASLLVSELVTNALLHAGTTIGLTARLGEAGLRVEVTDGSLHVPTPRRYAATSGTGRGMRMLEQLVDDWGVTRHDDGKTVWFDLSAADTGDDELVALRTDHDGRDHAAPVAGVVVHLPQMPLLLHAAWQEHAEALLREYLLSSLDREGEVQAIQVHADATDAIAILSEHVPRRELSLHPDELMADATEPFVTASDLVVDVPPTSVPHFQTLDDALDDCLALVETGRVLSPPTLPEIKAFRRWVCREVVEQAAGRRPSPWTFVPDPLDEAPPELSWDASTVRQADTALIVADEGNRIVAVSPPAAELLGYRHRRDLEGQRLATIIPSRFRQAHVAGFTLHLLVGRRPLLGTAVEVPALRADGGEVLVELVVTAQPPMGERRLFLAQLRAL